MLVQVLGEGVSVSVSVCVCVCECERQTDNRFAGSEAAKRPTKVVRH